MAKSNKLFTVAISDKAEMRDDLIADLFDIEKNKKLSFLSKSTWNISKTDNIGFAKTWKTKGGAKNSLTRIIKKANDRISRNNWYYGIKPNDYRFDIIEVDKDKWNSYIDGEISRAKNKMNRLINSWESKKLK